MRQPSFKSYYKLGSFLLKEAEGSEGIIKHLTHLEEIILTRKAEGLNVALNFINELNKIFKGHTDNKVFTTVKWDGAPAIVCGINPENNKFFVSTKSVANANPKVNYTQEDIQANHGNAPGLVQKLSAALSILPNVIKQGVYQGDFMFDKTNLQEINHEGVSYISFKPNTITYAVPSESELGRKIKNADIGIVFHTKYSGPSLSKLTKSSDVNSAEFNEVPNAWVEDAKFKDVSGIASFTEEEEKSVNEHMQKVQSLAKSVKWNSIADNVYAWLNTFINTLIREGKFVTNSEESFEQFVNWYTNKANKEIEKLKTEKGRSQKEASKQEMLKSLNNQKQTVLGLLKLTKSLEQLKMFFVKKYNDAIKTKQFLVQPDGSLKVTNPEGYVAVDHQGNMIKLVDRLEFSRANFSVSKEDKFKNENV